MRLSILDGMLSTATGSLTGGVFLVGFAVEVLRATPAQVGLLAGLVPFGE